MFSIFLIVFVPIRSRHAIIGTVYNIMFVLVTDTQAKINQIRLYLTEDDEKFCLKKVHHHSNRIYTK